MLHCDISESERASAPVRPYSKGYYVSGHGKGSFGAIDLPIVSLIRIILAPTVASGFLLLLSRWDPHAVPGGYVTFAAFSFVLSALVFGELSFYRSAARFPTRMALANILGRWAIAVGILALLALATGFHHYFSARVLLTWVVLTPLVLLAFQMLTRSTVQHLIAASHPPRTAVVVGATPLSAALRSEIEQDAFLNMRVAGFFDDRAVERIPEAASMPRLGTLSDLPAYVKEHSVAVIYLCLPINWQARVRLLLDDLRDTTASIYFVPDIFMFDLVQARIDRITGMPTIAIRETPFYGVRGVVKRSTDIALSGLALSLIWPALILIALGVKLSSAGPAIYKQTRYGLDGRRIAVYKFRTMRVCDGEDQVVQAKSQDPRVTGFGRFLRRTSLDELPQIVNVLQGHMSLVGPRPHAVCHNEMYRKLIKGYMLRHKVKPGITGLAQINGYRGETDTIEKMRGRVEHDIEYLRNWSLTLDIVILLSTVRLVFRDRNAY